MLAHSFTSLTHSLPFPPPPTHTFLQFTNADQITEKAPSGCYVSGLYLEGAQWDIENSCLAKSHPKVLIEELPVLRIIPIEAHRLKLVVSVPSPQTSGECAIASN